MRQHLMMSQKVDQDIGLSVWSAEMNVGMKNGPVFCGHGPCLNFEQSTCWQT
ncbi:MAG: hypothetical protein ACSHXI_04970 [Hoeflea sp.]|uniref:hypothetical protein n=1 Tax=Hoeflea sp. TaxID=1940281 RepID=UPI003EFB1CE2